MKPRIGLWRQKGTRIRDISLHSGNDGKAFVIKPSTEYRYISYFPWHKHDRRQQTVTPLPCMQPTETEIHPTFSVRLITTLDHDTYLIAHGFLNSFPTADFVEFY